DMNTCVFSVNNKWFATGHPQEEGRNEARLWDAQSGKQLWEHHNKGQSLLPLGFVDDGETVVLRSDKDGTVYLLDRATGIEKKSFPTAPRESWGQTLLSPNGKHLVICTLQPPSIWDLEGKKVATLEGHKSWGYVTAISPDGKK